MLKKGYDATQIFESWWNVSETTPAHRILKKAR